VARLNSRPPRHSKPLRLQYRTIRLVAFGLFGIVLGAATFFLIYGPGYSIAGAATISILVAVLGTWINIWMWERGRRVSGEARERGYRDSTGKR
jgi:hypothetical protein